MQFKKSFHFQNLLSFKVDKLYSIHALELGSQGEVVTITEESLNWSIHEQIEEEQQEVKNFQYLPLNILRQI